MTTKTASRVGFGIDIGLGPKTRKPQPLSSSSPPPSVSFLSHRRTHRRISCESHHHDRQLVKAARADVILYSPPPPPESLFGQFVEGVKSIMLWAIDAQLFHAAAAGFALKNAPADVTLWLGLTFSVLRFFEYRDITIRSLLLKDVGGGSGGGGGGIGGGGGSGGGVPGYAYVEVKCDNKAKVKISFPVEVLS